MCTSAFINADSIYNLFGITTNIPTLQLTQKKERQTCSDTSDTLRGVFTLYDFLLSSFFSYTISAGVASLI